MRGRRESENSNEKLEEKNSIIGEERSERKKLEEEFK